MMYEQRRFTRVKIGKLCSIATPEGQVVPAEIVDASIIGMRLAAGEALHIGTQCTVLLTPEVDNEIEIRATLLAKSENGFHVEANAIRADSFKHWRELIVNHAEDSYKMDTEITSRMNIWPDSY